jgi:hypothetical protein
MNKECLGKSSLMIACEKGHMECIKVLSKHLSHLSPCR